MWTLHLRGLAPSLAAGGSLVVALLLCLLAVSAMLGFQGWPGPGEERSDGSLSLRVPEGKVSGRTASGPLPAAALAPPAGGDVAGDEGAAPAPARRTPSGRSGGGGAPQTPAAGTPTTPAPSQPAPVADAPAGPAPAAGGGGSAGGETGGGGGGGNGGGSTPGTVEGIVVTGRGTVTRLTAPLPPAPPEAQRPVENVLDTAQGTARTVDGVVGGVPIVGETVDHVGETAGGLLP